jgi:hypothetical protein
LRTLIFFGALFLIGLALFVPLGNAQSAPASESRLSRLAPAAVPPSPAAAFKPSGALLVVGDSLAVGLGAALTQDVRNWPGLKVWAQGKTSSGLCSPRFYNWDKKLAELIQTRRPDAVVVHVGGNDAYIHPASPNWLADYAQKLKRFVRIAVDQGLPVFLVQLPPMKSADYHRRVAAVNQVMKTVCQETPGCQFVETWSVMAENGQNFMAGRKVAGKYQSLRAKDGHHLTFAGYQLVGGRVLAGVTRVLPASPAPAGPSSPTTAALPDPARRKPSAH